MCQRDVNCKKSTPTISVTADCSSTMLPLRSQICSLSRDSIEQNTSAKLQLNRITLCQNTVPMPNDGRPYIDRKLLGGILSLSDIMMKETTPLAQSIHFSTEVTSILQSSFSGIIPSIDSNSVGNKSVKDDNLRCCFGNLFYSTFRTNRAQIPLWGDVEDLSETFSTTLRFKSESQPMFVRQPCAPRNSIIGKSRKVEDFLKNETSAVEVVATIKKESATLRQMERWGIRGKSSEENDADDTQQRNTLISSEFIVVPLEELRELFQENTASYNTSDLLDTGYHGSLIRAAQLTSKLVEMYFNEDGRNEIFPMQTIKNLTLTRADFVGEDLLSNSHSKLINLYPSSVDDAILHDDARGFRRFIDPWAASLRNIESFKGCRTIFQDLDILNPNSFELSNSGKMEGLTWLGKSSMSGLLFYCPLLLKENTPKEHWIHEEKTNEVSCKACQLQDQLLETSKFHGKLTLLKEDKVWNGGDAGFLKDRLLNSTHAFRCIPIVPNSKTIDDELPDINCQLEGQEYIQNWTWQPVQTRKQSVVEIMKISRSLLVRHQQGISASYNDAGCQPRHRPRMQLKKNSILHKSTNYTFWSMLKGYHDQGLDHQSAVATHTIIQKNPESNIIKFIYFAFLPAILQHISPEVGVNKMTTIRNTTNESNSVTGKISELSAAVQASESLPTEFETDDRKRSYMIDSSKNEDDGGQKTEEIHHSQEQKGIPHQYLSRQYESTPSRIQNSSNTPIVISTVKAATASNAKCPDNMTDLITQSLDLDQMVSSYLVMHGNPQALVTKAVLTPTSLAPSKIIIRPDTVSNASDRPRFMTGGNSTHLLIAKIVAEKVKSLYLNLLYLLLKRHTFDDRGYSCPDQSVCHYSRKRSYKRHREE